MLRRRNFNIQAGVNCVLCASGLEEDIYHLLFDCPFATRCWHKLQIHWDLTLDIHDRIPQAKDAFMLSFFYEIFFDCSMGNLEAQKCCYFRGSSSNLSPLDREVQRPSAASTSSF